MEIENLLRTMMEKGASDLHINVGSPPTFRIDGQLQPTDSVPLNPEDTRVLMERITNEEQKQRFLAEKELDFSYSLPGTCRFRVNLYWQRGSIGAVFRTIPFEVPDIDQLGLPSICKTLALKPRGLVLVTGPTGSGKSTTLAAMIGYINSSRSVHIVTLEDPIEFVHQDKKSIISQREVGDDTKSFAAGLKRVLRQDPDVILVGEMRDLETISAAVTAAETGHLVLATLHTTGAPQTIDRVIDVFPPHQQEQIRIQLSTTLEGVLSQTLLPKIDGGRICAMEIMVGIPAIRNLIREGKTHLMINTIQTGAQYEMQTLDHALEILCRKKIVTVEDALEKANDPASLKKALGMQTASMGSGRMR